MYKKCGYKFAIIISYILVLNTTILFGTIDILLVLDPIAVSTYKKIICSYINKISFSNAQ